MRGGRVPWAYDRAMTRPVPAPRPPTSRAQAPGTTSATGPEDDEPGDDEPGDHDGSTDDAEVTDDPGAADLRRIDPQADPAASASSVATDGSDWIDLASTPSLATYVASLWRRRSFAVEVARSNVRSEHVDSVLGEAWFLLNPLLLIGVYWLIFGVFLQIDRGVEGSYPAFVAIGVFTFDLSRSGMMRSSGCMVRHVGLVRSLHFPRALIPIAVALEQGYRYLPEMVVVMGILLATGETPQFGWLAVLPILVVQTIFTLGAGLFVARLGHHAHDARNALPFLLRLAFYLSGILYSVDDLLRRDEVLAFAGQYGLGLVDLRRLALLNPFYDYVTLARHYLMAAQPSKLPVVEVWAAAVAWALVALVAGLAWFRRAERDFGRE